MTIPAGPSDEQGTSDYQRGVEAEREAWKTIVARERLICGIACPCGPNGELLACALPPNPPNQPMHEHSWASLPTFTDAVRWPTGEAAEQQLAEVLEDLFPVAQQRLWPFTVADAARAILAALHRSER